MKKNIYFTTLRVVALIGALVLIILLLFSSSAQKNTYDNNILFVVDLSYSMNAKDVGLAEGKISRLEAAKKIMLQTLAAGGEANYGLVVFSQSATQYIPLTADTGTFLDYLKNVNTGLLPGGGTDRNSLEKIFSGNTSDYSKIIFISDAETQDEIPTWKILKHAKVYFLGVGTKQGGNPTLPNGTIMKLKQNNIISSFDLGTATAISTSLNAKLFPLENVNNLDAIIDEIISSSPSFSRSQVQILIVVLGVFILLAL